MNCCEGVNEGKEVHSIILVMMLLEFLLELNKSGKCCSFCQMQDLNEARANNITTDML